MSRHGRCKQVRPTACHVWRLGLSCPAQLVSCACLPCAGASCDFLRTPHTRRLALRLNRPLPIHAFLCTSILSVAFALFMLPLPHGWSEGWRCQLTNCMHTPLMGLCYVAWAALLRRVCPTATCNLLSAAIVTAMMAALVEWVQPWFGRTASLVDFLWGLVGVLCGFLWQWAGRMHAMRLRHAAQLLAVACVLAPPVAWWTQIRSIQAEAQRLFPMLADSAHLHMHPLWTIEPAPGGANPHTLLLSRDADHPASMHLDALDRDWSGYAGLEISGSLQAASAVEIGIRVDLDAPAGSRVQAGGLMQPGTSEIQVYWSQAAPGMRVHQLVVFLAASPAAARLEIHRLRLIPMKNHPSAEADTAIPAASSTKFMPSAGLQGSVSNQ
jgi:hypothetical protein